MKKVLALILAAAMLLTASALAEAGGFTGVWYLNAVNVAGQEIDPLYLDMEMSLELKDDGTAIGITVLGGDTEEDQGTWALEGDGVVVIIEDVLTLAFEDGNLVGEQDGMGVVFGREKAEVEAYEPAAPIAAEAADFEGSWTAFKYGKGGFFADAEIMGMDVTAEFKGSVMKLKGFIYADEDLRMTFADGAYTYETSDEFAIVDTARAELLEDGNLQLALSMGGMDVVLIMAPDA